MSAAGSGGVYRTYPDNYGQNSKTIHKFQLNQNQLHYTRWQSSEIPSFWLTLFKSSQASVVADGTRSFLIVQMV